MTAGKPLVIDIYYGDPVQDFAATRAFGIVGVIHKASEGTGFTDKLYAARRKLATGVGMKWGAYHFFHGQQPKLEADHFLSVAQPDADTLLALDWENVGDGAPSAAAARVFLERIEEKLGRKAVSIPATPPRRSSTARTRSSARIGSGSANTGRGGACRRAGSVPGCGRTTATATAPARTRSPASRVFATTTPSSSR
jgi:hypothetical protein